MGNKKHVVNVLFTLLLLGVFALCAVFVSVLGAEVYRNSAARMQSNFDTRTSLVYIAEKLRQSASADFAIREIGGGQALVISEKYDDDKIYETWIFVSAGKLREATVAAGENVGALGGQEIMDMKSMAFEMDVGASGGEANAGAGGGTENENAGSAKLVRITSVNSAGDEESLTIGRRG